MSKITTIFCLFYVLYRQIMQVKMLSTETVIMGNLVNFSIIILHIISVLEKGVTISYLKYFTININQTNRTIVCSSYQVDLFLIQIN